MTASSNVLKRVQRGLAAVCNLYEFELNLHRATATHPASALNLHNPAPRDAAAGDHRVSSHLYILGGLKIDEVANMSIG